MCTVVAVGDVTHPLATAVLKKTQETKKNNSGLTCVLDFCLQQEDGSAEGLVTFRKNIYRTLRALVNEAGFRGHYIHITCHGALRDDDLVKRFAYDYGLSVRIVDLGVLYGSDVQSYVSDLLERAFASQPLSVPRSNPALHFTHIRDATSFILRVVNDRDAENYLEQQEKVRCSEFAAQVSSLLEQPRVHLVFE